MGDLAESSNMFSFCKVVSILCNSSRREICSDMEAYLCFSCKGTWTDSDGDSG